MKQFLFNKRSLFFSLLLIASLCRAQIAPQIKWQNSLGGTSEDAGSSVINTRDGGSIIAGYTSSKNGDVHGPNHGSYDMWIVKLNNKGKIEKEKNFGGSSADFGTSIKQTFDGGYIVAGTSESRDIDLNNNYGNNDGWIVKFDSMLNIQWQKNCGGSNYDVFNEVINTFDSCYVTVGFTVSNDHDIINPNGGGECWIAKLSKNGNILWSKCFGKGNESGHSIQQTKDSGFIVLSNSYTSRSDSFGHHGNDDCWVIKLNKKGIIEWSKYFGGNSIDDGVRIKQTKDGGYVFCASTISNNGDVSGNHGLSDYWVVKLSATGILKWQNCFGGSGDEYAHDIIETTNNEYVIAGYANSNDGNVTYNHSVYVPDYWIIKLSNAGKLLWQKSYGGLASDVATSIAQTTDGGFLITGNTFSNNGDIKGYHGRTGGDAWTIRLYPDKRPANPFNISQINKIDSDLVKRQNIAVSLYPNPATNILTITGLNGSVESNLSIMDEKSNLVTAVTTKDSHYYWNIQSLASGVYFIKIEAAMKTSILKFVKR